MNELAQEPCAGCGYVDPKGYTVTDESKRHKRRLCRNCYERASYLRNQHRGQVMPANCTKSWNGKEYSAYNSLKTDD